MLCKAVIITIRRGEMAFRKVSLFLIFLFSVILIQSHIPLAQEFSQVEYDCATEDGRPLPRYCIYTDGRSGQEGLFNDPGICIARLHEQVYRIRVECLDQGFKTWIWDGLPQVGDYIDTLGCNAIRVIAYTQAPPNKERVQGCVAEYCIPLPQVQRWGPVSEAKAWDFSLWGQNFCRQRADERNYNPDILAKLRGILEPDTIIGFWRGLEFDHIIEITKVGKDHYKAEIIDPACLSDFGFKQGELLISDLVFIKKRMTYEGKLKYRWKRGGYQWVNLNIVLKEKNTFLADGKKSIRVQGDKIIKKKTEPFRISLDYPQSVVVDDPNRRAFTVSWGADLEFPVTVTIIKKPGWNPPYGGNFPLARKEFDRAYRRGGENFVTWGECVYCWGYRRRWAATFTINFEVTVTDKNGRKSEPADINVVCIVDK